MLRQKQRRRVVAGAVLPECPANRRYITGLLNGIQKFLGEIERGQQNPSFNILVKIASALEVELPELFRLENEISDRKEIEARIRQILKTIPEEALRQLLLILRTFYPME